MDFVILILILYENTLIVMKPKREFWAVIPNESSTSSLNSRLNNQLAVELLELTILETVGLQIFFIDSCT